MNRSTASIRLKSRKPSSSTVKRLFCDRRNRLTKEGSRNTFTTWIDKTSFRDSFMQKKRFVRDEVESMSQIDYIRNLTIVAVVGEFGFGRVVGVGEYYLDEAKNLAEIAFSVSKDYQGKRLGRILIRKLAEAARENGIFGLFAITSPQNQRMIKLFKTLPYKVVSVLGDDLLLNCRFDDPA